MNQVNNKEIIEVSIEDIVPNRFQPRLTFDMDALNELANSIREHGIIQPLVVRSLQDKYEIIAGERRYKAASLIGMKKVPCIVMNLSDNESAEVAVIENIQRKEMTPLEEAKSFKKILDKGYLTQEELARRMGKSQSSIANKLRLLNLDEVVQDAILEGKISERHARSLLKIENPQEQRNILSEIITKRLTVRQTDDLIKEKYGKEDDKMNTNEFGNSIFKDPIKEEPVQQNNMINQMDTRYMSSPNINIPINNVTEEVNPQLNIMNNIGMSNAVDNQNNIQQQQNISSPNPSLDIFKMDAPSLNINSSQEDIKSVINPSVFSNENNTYINNGMSVDINQIKNNAQSINVKEEPNPQRPNLMSSDSKSENKFFVDLGISPENTFNDKMSFKVKTAVDAINRKVDEIKIQGTNVIKEEKDLGNSYQIIIRIDK